MKHFIAAMIIASIFCPYYMNSSECTGKAPKEKLSLFEHAEECSQELLAALALCQTQGNCAHNRLLAQAAHSVHYCKQNLREHLKKLDDRSVADRCNACEKNETLGHHDALGELLTIKEVKEVLLNFPLSGVTRRRNIMPPISH